MASPPVWKRPKITVNFYDHKKKKLCKQKEVDALQYLANKAKQGNQANATNYGESAETCLPNPASTATTPAIVPIPCLQESGGEAQGKFNH